MAEQDREHRTGQWPSEPPPAADRKAEEIRENLMGAGSEAPPPTIDPGVAGAESGRAEEAAPEQASAARADGAFDSPDGLFETARVEEFRRRWDAIKAAFVDDPREAVQRAEELTDDVVSELTAVMDARRHDLAERRRDSGTTDDKAQTERLRVVLHGYRSVLDPVLRS